MSILPCRSGEPPSEDATEPRLEEGREGGREDGRDAPPSAKVLGGSTITSTFLEGLLFSSLITMGGGMAAVGKGETGREMEEELDDNFCREGIEPEQEQEL